MWTLWIVVQADRRGIWGIGEVPHSVIGELKYQNQPFYCYWIDFALGFRSALIGFEMDA